MTGIMLALLLALAAQPPAAPPAPSGIAGTYTLDDGEPNSVAVLELADDGRFRFAISAGFLDARSEGRWTSEDGAIILNTDPRPELPEFTAGSVTRTSEAPLLILVNGPDEKGVASIDLRIGLADGTTIEGYTQYDGWRPDGEQEAAQVARSRPLWVELSLVPFGVAPKRFPLDPSRGNAFSFTLQPNDFGVWDFRDERVQIVPEGLRWSGTQVRGLFRRER